MSPRPNARCACAPDRHDVRHALHGSDGIVHRPLVDNRTIVDQTAEPPCHRGGGDQAVPAEPVAASATQHAEPVREAA